MSVNDELQQLNNFCHELVKYVNQASGIQSALPTTLKRGGETRPWRSLHSMFSSVVESHASLIPILKERKKEHIVTRIDIDLLREVVAFLNKFSSLFDILEYATIPTLQNSLPVYYTLYEEWQPENSDSELLSLLKSEFLSALTDKFWSSLSMPHFVATFLDPTLRDFQFVTSSPDRVGFFKQVKEIILSLAQEPQTEIPDKDLNRSSSSSSTSQSPSTSNSVIISAAAAAGSESSEPVKKKSKINPFEWFQKSTNIAS